MTQARRILAQQKESSDIYKTKNKETRGDKDKRPTDICTPTTLAIQTNKNQPPAAVLMYGVPIITKSGIQRMTAKVQQTPS